MNAIDRLVAEHDLIERALGLLEIAVARIESGQPLSTEFPLWAVGFFQEFADQCHHAKEEDVFFPLLKERGIPEQGGPIGVMLHEHVLGRDCLRRMRDACQSKPFKSGQFVEGAKQFIPLLRQHIFKENNVLFRIAERVMSEADDADVTSQFALVEQERGLTGKHEFYSQEVAGLEEEFK